ncbi:MAG TPA: S8 family peptidase [Gemmatimonadaceae bacterium]|nr:S8 family peptidase [Gemmatimonadaceae bacterium]
MRRRVPLPTRPFRTALAVTATLVGGCAPATRGVTAATLPGDVASAASAVAPVTTEYVESQTVSFALDRIDQRSLPLDRTYRRFGTGSGVTVYVFDGGILATHPELAGRVRRGFNAFPGEDHLCNAHGTAVAGAVAGTTLGAAPGAEIVDVKMVECRRLRGTIEAIVQGTRWVIADAARHPERRAVANWSFIADTAATIPALDSAVTALRDAGIPVVVSAGNIEMNACRVAPANSPGALVVGASRIRRVGTDSTARLADARTPGTAFGACLDVFAPGDSVLLPSIEGRTPTTQLWTGTSMSAGYVSGAIALYLEAHPDASPDDVAGHIRSTSRGTVVDPVRSPRTGLLYIAPPRQATVAAR